MRIHEILQPVHFFGVVVVVGLVGTHSGLSSVFLRLLRLIGRKPTLNVAFAVLRTRKLVPSKFYVF